MKYPSIEPLESRIAPATLSINSVSLFEGNSGQTSFVFTVTLSEAPVSGTTIEVSYATADGTAVSSGPEADYIARSGLLVFTAGGALQQTITVPVIGDVIGEADETFTVTLSNPSAGHTISEAVGTGTIRNDPGVLTVTAPTDVFEGNTGTRVVNYSVTLTTEGDQVGDISADYLFAGTTSTNSATPGTDFQGAPGTITFTPGSPRTQEIPVTIVGDIDAEGDETFEIRLSNLVGATLANTSRITTIREDTLTIRQLTPTIVEGASGQQLVTYEIELSDYNGTFPAQVSYATQTGGSAGTASAGSDFGSVTGTLTFNGVGVQTITVPVYGDTVAEENETFTLRATIATPARTFTRELVSTIQNDDVSVSIADNAFVAAATKGLAEGDSTTTAMQFRISLTGALNAPATVRYRTVNGTAVAGSDFEAQDQAVVFNPGETEKTISVPIFGDTVAELSESFTVQVYQVDGGAGVSTTIARANGTGVINNDDTIMSVVSTGNRAEGQSGLTNFGFRAQISTPLPGDITLTYKTEDGTATAGSGDYVAVPAGSVVIRAGQTQSDEFFVAVRGDTVREANETFRVTLDDNQQNAIFGSSPQRTATATILNDDPFLTISDVTVNEGTGGTSQATFVVTLSSAPQANERVEVKFGTVNGTATGDGANADFVAQANQTLVFNTGTLQRTITVDITGDNRFEGASETFSVLLSDAKLITTDAEGDPTSEAALTIARASGTATILDDDRPTVSITPAVRTAENSGPAAFVVSLSNPTEVPIDVTVSSRGVTATAGVDFNPVATTLRFNGGQEQTVNVALLGDATNEPDETFEVVLSNARVVSTGAALTITNAIGVGTIANDDRIVSIANATLSESGGTMNFPVTISPAVSDQPVTVFFTTRETTAIDGTRATAGADFTARTGSVVIPAGSSLANIAIPILNDTTDEFDQRFEVVITGVTNAVAGLGVATGTIIDDDAAPTVQVVSSVSVNEGTNDSDVGISVVLSRPSEKPVTVSYATAPGTATAGSDFTSKTDTVTIPAGAASASFGIQIKGDTIAEPNEIFTVTISSPVNATLGTQTTSTVTIVNDDVAPTLSIADVSARENAGTMTFTVSLSRAYGELVTVQFTTVDSTANAGSDYTLTAGTLTFNANETSKTIVVPIANNDAIPEGDERFLVRLSNATNATIFDNEAVGLIQNDDVAFTVQDLTIAEEGAGNAAQTALVIVTRTGTVAASVQYRTVDGTALSTSGRDFAAQTGTLNFAAGETTKTIAIPITRDFAYENAEQFTVELFSPVDGVIADGTATVTITDNDAAPTLSVAPATFTEGGTGGQMRFVVQLSAPNEREDVRLQFETIDGTAISTGALADFTATASELRFAQGESSKEISVLITNDTRDEADETFTLRLKNANAPFAGGGLTRDVIGTIVDNDAAPTVSLGSALTISESESGSAARVFTVTLSQASGQTVTVNWATATATEGTPATAGVDYTAVAPTLLTFAPGETQKTFSVAIFDDAIDEENERFDVVLSSATNATIGVARSFATITDNDEAPALTIGDATIVEGAAPALLFTVNLSAASGRVITVRYSTADGTATSSGAFADFTSFTNETLTIQPGETSKTIAIPIIDDQFREVVFGAANEAGEFPEEAEKFTITLTAPTNATIADGTATGSIFNGSDSVLGLTITDTALVEGNSGTTQMTFRVQLSSPAEETISFNAATRNGTAIGGVDFGAINNTVSIAGPSGDGADRTPGANSADISVNITGDGTFEATEGFFLDLSNFTGQAVSANLDSNGRLTARGTIYNDDFNLLNNGRTAQWIDVDGDLVTLTTTRGSFAGLDTAQFTEGTTQKLWLQPTGDVGGRQLVLLSVLNLPGFFGASLSITADPQPGFPGSGDGRVNVGEIRAGQRVGGELDWQGIDLLDVTVEGDLGRILAGDNISTTALRKLDVQSLGTLGTSSTGADIASEILGPVGTVIVRGDFGGQLKLIGEEFGRLGTLRIDGALRGGSVSGTGSVIVSGRIGTATIGEIIGGSGQRTGALLGNEVYAGSIGNVTVLGAVKGGSGQQSGVIIGSQLGHLKIGSLEGGSGADSGLVFANIGNVASLSVSGAISGGAGDGSGQVVATGALGAFKAESITGGAGKRSGRITSVNSSIASVTVDGAIVGGVGDNSGQIFARTNIGPVKLTNLTGGDGDASGTVGITKTDSVDSANNPVYATSARLGNVTATGSVTGGEGDFSGVFSAGSAIGATRIDGDLTGGAGVTSGVLFSAGTIGTVTIGNDIVGGAGIESGVIKVARMGTVNVRGDIVGGAGNESGSIEGTSVSALTVTGPIVGGAGQLSGSVRLADDAGRVSIGANASGHSIVGGSGVSSGRLQVADDLNSVVLAGNIIGGTANFTGALSIGGDLVAATIRGSIIGGTSAATGAALQNSGFLQAGLLRSAVINGDLRAGIDGGAGITNSGVIRTGRIVGLTIDGNVTGSAAVPAIISGAAAIDASDVAIQSLLIKGNVSFAEVLAGYGGDVSQGFRGQITSADAQISRLEVRGTTSGLNVIAGVLPGADGRFGDASDVVGFGTGVRDSARVISSIATVILRGSVANTNAASYGIVAQHVVSVQTGPTLTPLAGLARGAGNDLATATPDASDLIATNFRAVEVPV